MHFICWVRQMALTRLNCFESRDARLKTKRTVPAPNTFTFKYGDELKLARKAKSRSSRPKLDCTLNTGKIFLDFRFFFCFQEILSLDLFDVEITFKNQQRPLLHQLNFSRRSATRNFFNENILKRCVLTILQYELAIMDNAKKRSSPNIEKENLQASGPACKKQKGAFPSFK